VVSVIEADVESPGGTVVCTLPVSITQKLNVGNVLEPDEFTQFLVAYRSVRNRFVTSRLFDAFAGPWESTLRSLVDDRVVEVVVRSGLAPDAYELVDQLRARFSRELCSVLAQSHVFKRRYMMVFSKAPSTDTLMRKIRDGQFDGIAQTGAFIKRVVLIKGMIDSVLLKAESHNVYLPTYITAAQRGLPLRPRVPLVGVEGFGMSAMPRMVANHLRSGSEAGGAQFYRGSDSRKGADVEMDRLRQRFDRGR